MTYEEIDRFIATCRQGIAGTRDQRTLYDRIVNTPFGHKLETTLLGLGIVVLLVKNEADNTIDRVALSRTERAEGAVEISVKKFEEIRIPADYQDNALVQVIDRDEFKIVTDWKYMFTPVLTPQEARLNQAGAAIDCSVIYPLSGFNGGGAMIFSYFEPMSKLTNAHHRFMGGYAQACATALRALPQAS